MSTEDSSIVKDIIHYVVVLAVHVSTIAVEKICEHKLTNTLKKKKDLEKALASIRSIRDEVRASCIELAKNRTRTGVSKTEESLWALLADDSFQADLSTWLITGAIEEGNEVKERLLNSMEAALSDAGATPEQITFLKTQYFETIEKTIFSNQTLANWRNQRSFDYLSEQVAVLRKHAEEAAGVFPPEKQKQAIDHYCEKALSSWDIVDLCNLPEGDIHIATQQLLLRQLYMPLRIEVDPTRSDEGEDSALKKLEKEREYRRLREAGRISSDESEYRDREKKRVPVGERLDAAQRLVVLGDPGGGKTTMLRWMATAYLLRHKGDNDVFNEIPDVQTLPAKPWIPVLIRCRDLGEADLCRSFTDFLSQHLCKTELHPNDVAVMQAVILERIAKGEVLLLVDGLDEIANPRVRMQFCQELERTVARYPDAPIVVTSRIVGYRDMPYRMRSGFEHSQIAELDSEDKDHFARRWVDVTEHSQTASERAKRTKELLEALHSSDRIARLTGNPMLLTTLALVKRKVGKLPNKRSKLYAEAVSVLLNWNPERYEIIDEGEVLPQLQYLAYAMCRRGVQRLANNDILDILDKLREEYPHIRAIRRQSTGAFLQSLAARSSILIQSGSIWKKSKRQDEAVWEFRHLTFQEYLAARALIEGRYPLQDKTVPLSQLVASLAGTITQKPQLPFPWSNDIEVVESWRETLRLLVADCTDDDVDEVLRAILTPLPDENDKNTQRPRAVLAALCLADEPNVGEKTAQDILDAFASVVGDDDGRGSVETTLDRAAIETGNSIWRQSLKKALINEFKNRVPARRGSVGGLWGIVEMDFFRRSGDEPESFFTCLVERLQSTENIEVISATLAIMEASYEQQVVVVDNLISSLIKNLSSSDLPIRFASTLALDQLTPSPVKISYRRNYYREATYWKATDEEVISIIQILDVTCPPEYDTIRLLTNVLGATGNKMATPILASKLSVSDKETLYTVIEALARLGDKQAVAPLLSKLDDPDEDIRRAAIKALVRLGDKQAVAPLLSTLADSNDSIRRAAIEALGQLGDKQAVAPLLATLNDFNDSIRRVAIEALGQLGDKQAVAPLLAKLDDYSDIIRYAAIEALERLGDKQAVVPLLPMLNNSNDDIRYVAIGALGQLGDKQAVAPLLPTLNDSDDGIRRATIVALGRLGDKQAIVPLLSKLNNQNDEDLMFVTVALHALKEPKGTEIFKQTLVSDDKNKRMKILETYAAQRNELYQELLSHDLDATDPWLDPQEQITEDRVDRASDRLNLPSEEIRSCYEAMADDLNLTLAWKQ